MQDTIRSIQQQRQKSLEWYNRATEVIPGGVYGHTSPAASLPITFPYYVERADGPYIWDVDGNRYLDFLCAYGPIILGNQHPEVETAVQEVKAKGGLFSHPSTKMVELAELLVKRVSFADWAVFAKNGSDVTTWAMQVARQHTGKKKVLVVNGAYHGVDAWTNPSPGGIIEEDRIHIHGFDWNDSEGLGNLVEEHRGEIAALMINPYHHPAFGPNIDPSSVFIDYVNSVCESEGIVLILDDIRAGFRLHPNGSHEIYHFRPDIACYCKALGNGYPISAAVGRKRLQNAAGKVFLTGSYWNDATAMTAAMKCLEIIERDQVPERLSAMGERLLLGLEAAGEKAGVNLRGCRPAAAPTIAFEGDSDLRLLQRFAELCAERGVLFHPHHNWFISLAHTEEIVDEAIAVASEALLQLSIEIKKNNG